MEKTLGGDRIGSGKKIKVDLHGWGRSTFNQDRVWRSTMAPGILVPCFTEIGLNGTTFDIDINTLAHTIPTISPLFGSFKLQVDMYACPIRLYQGLLHNNALNIGLDMSQVLLPNIILNPNNNSKKSRTNTTSLANYLGIKGYTPEKKTFNAIPFLAYYDIFKNYYANKQEKFAKVIGTLIEDTYINYINIKVNDIDNNFEVLENSNYTTLDQNSQTFDIFNRLTIQVDEIKNIKRITLNSDNAMNCYADVDTSIVNTRMEGGVRNPNKITKPCGKLKTLGLNGEERELCNVYLYDNKEFLILNNLNTNGNLGKITDINIEASESNLDIQDFPLENIDKARREILAKTNLMQRLNLNTNLNFTPYSLNYEDQDVDWKDKHFTGLVLKTYQSDIFNCWLTTEYVELINNISSVTPDENGKISMDALILAKKVYNMLNRIAVSGGTYEDWQESVFGEQAPKRAESPIYIGGTSAEITFEEVVSTASSENANGENQPLATLGGKGIMTNHKGGQIIFKCEEPCIIMGIASITPRVDYHQGNMWYMTDLDNMDNFHKPGLDGIGFQNLIANNVVWSESPNKALAKQTAWINYQTSFNQVFGQFAEDGETGLAHMVLRRDWETDENGEITDFTTYIDPSKFNYAFAENQLTSQNFWVQLGFDVKSRRKMAAYEIPNL